MKEMSRNDTIQMMQQCVEEISSLQQQVAALQPRAHAYDTVSQILSLMPQPSRGYGEDIVWRLKNQIAEMQEQPKSTQTNALPEDVKRLVIAARKFTFEDMSEGNLKELDRASEAFAARVAWDDQPEEAAS